MAIYPAETAAQAVANQNLANAKASEQAVANNYLNHYHSALQQGNPLAREYQQGYENSYNQAARLPGAQVSATYNPSATAAINNQVLNKQLAGTNANTQIYNASSAPTGQQAAAPAPTATYAMQPIAQQAPAPAPNPMASRINAIGSAIAGRAQ